MSMTNLTVIEQTWVGKRVIIAGAHLPCDILRGTCHSIQQLPTGINVFHITLDTGGEYRFHSINVLLFSASEGPIFNSIYGPQKMTTEPTGNRAKLNARLKAIFPDKNQLYDALDAGLVDAVSIMCQILDTSLGAHWIIKELEQGHVESVLRVARQVKENSSLILEWVKEFLPEYLNRYKSRSSD